MIKNEKQKIYNNKSTTTTTRITQKQIINALLILKLMYNTISRHYKNEHRGEKQKSFDLLNAYNIKKILCTVNWSNTHWNNSQYLVEYKRSKEISIFKYFELYT